MGCEYTINFEEQDTNEIASFLKSLPYFQNIIISQKRNQYIYRTPDNPGPLPSGLAEITPSGIYFCDYGEGENILKEMIFQLALSYKSIELIDDNN